MGKKSIFERQGKEKQPSKHMCHLKIPPTLQMKHLKTVWLLQGSRSKLGL